MADDELKRARSRITWIEKTVHMASPHGRKMLNIALSDLRALADEVERLREFEQAYYDAKLREVEVWKPLLAAAKSHQWIYDEIGWEEMRRAIARAEEALKTEDRGT